jgi:hypothetical protein
VFDTYPISTTTRTEENIRMTILSNGNVGIGTTTPTALLDVNGDVVISGDLTAENLIISSINVITELTALQGRQEIEEPKTTALQILTAGHTTDLATNTADILTKQSTITIAADLECNSLTISNLNVDTRTKFDTIVLRRPSGITGEVGDFYLAFRELQCWVNGSNLLQSTATTKFSFFANFLLNKELDIGELQLTSLGVNSLASNIYNNNFSSIYDTHSKENNSDENISLIIRNIPLTTIETIQSLVLYNRTGLFNNTTIGVAIELYNSITDPDLNTILATTEVITTAENVYRFDFPSIDTYTGSFATVDSLTLIPDDTHSTKQVVSVSTPPPIEITGDIVASGSITASNAIVNGFNINTTLTDILTRLLALENP